MALTVATWNVNGIRARQAQFLEWLERDRPDVVCLQEIKASPAQLAEELCELGDYWCYWHGSGGYSGVSLHLRRGVFPEEPKGRGDEFVSALRGLPNVILTPHIGGSTEEAQQDIGEFVAGKLADYMASGATSRQKRFRISGVAPGAIHDRLAALIPQSETPGVSRRDAKGRRDAEKTSS